MATEVLHCDIAVLGAGPAGIATALALHQKGRHVVLIGKAAADALKVGEFLPASMQRMFRTLDLGKVEDVLGPDSTLHCQAKSSAWGSDDWTYQDGLRDPEGGGWHILRHRFEQRLLDIARQRGIPHRDGRLVELSDNGTDYRVEAAGDDGPITVQCPRLVDATGRAAWLVRRVADAPRKRNTQMAVAGWVLGTPGTVERVTRVKSVENGWWYTAPLPGRQRVIVFHGMPDSVSHLMRQPGEFLQLARQAGLIDHATANAERLAPLQSCDASVGLSPNVAGKRWLAVGDAALSFDPLSSQGMHFAFYSAIKARDAVCNAVRAADEQDAYLAMERYCTQISDVFEVNQRTRFLFYNQEARYRHAPYWQEQRGKF